MISLKNIYKWYKNSVNRTFILKDINLNVDEGEFIVLQYPGKSIYVGFLLIP